MTAIALLALLASAQFDEFPAPARHAAKSLNILVFSKTAGFRHDCIPDAHAAIQKVCDAQKWTATHTEDSGVFVPGNLKNFDVVVFECTTGDVLNDAQQAAFEAFVKNGGGYVGVHAASDTEYDWPWYGRLVGAYFKGHPAIQPATILVEDRKHPSTKMLPHPWKRTDEWYSFRSNPRQEVHVLACLDDNSYKGGTMGSDHPIMWCHDFGGGRAWYTAMGHVKESYTEPLFMSSLQEGIRWASAKSRRK
jgi:type 1 glutamine amidotransferase